MTGPQVQAQRSGAAIPYPSVETLESLTEYFTANHTAGGMDPATMAQMTLDSRYGGSNYVGLAHDAQGRNVASDGVTLVDEFGRPLSGAGTASYWENGKQIAGVPDWAGGTTATATSATADQQRAATAAAAERDRLARVAAADAAERARLEAERAAAIALAAKVNATSGTPPPTPPRVFTLSSPSVINANRPVDDRPMTGDSALTLSGGGAYSPPGAPQILPTSNTTATAPADWKKYLPYALGALVLVLLVLALKPKKHAGGSS